MLRSGVSAKSIQTIVSVRNIRMTREEIKTYAVGFVVVLILVREVEVDLLEKERSVSELCHEKVLRSRNSLSSGYLLSR